MTTLDEARYHLRIDSTEYDAEIGQKLALAEAIVADYIGQNTQLDAYVSAAAVMLVLGELWLNRESSSADVLSPAVRSLLERQKVQALA